jgi:hypothetical protein
MMRLRSIVIGFSLLLSTFAAFEMCVSAQPNKPGGPQAGSSTPGDSRLLSDWLVAYPADPGFSNEKIIEFKAVETTFGSSQPIVLEPISLPSAVRPLADSQKLVVKIDDPNDLFEKYCASVLNLNVASQAGSAESPASLRPTQSAGGGGPGGGGAGVAALVAAGANPSLEILPSAQCLPVGTTATFTVYGIAASAVGAGTLVTFTPGGGGPTYSGQTDGNGMVSFTPPLPGKFTASAALPAPSPVQPPAPGAPPPTLNVTASIQAYASAPHVYFLPWNERISPDTAITVSVTALTPALSQDPTGSTAQPIAVLNQTFNHVHALNTFNISTGIIYSWLRNPAFTRQESSAAVTCPSGSTGCTAEPEMYQTVMTQGSRSVDPALFFTVYAFGKFDAERKWHLSDLKPEPSVGLSLSSPTADYFFGAQSEVWRGVQFVAGLHEGERNQLVPPLVNDPTSSTAPQTKLAFSRSGFIGITFNISFVQSLFGGGKGAAQ